MRVRLTHIDGKLPNLALMKLAHWHRARGDSVSLERTPTPSMFEPVYDRVYGSAIFKWSAPVVQRFKQSFPGAIVGGTGVDGWETVETLIGQPDYEQYDYTIYPDYPWSLGFTQRGCRLKCGFCVVPQKEGKPRATNTIYSIWREGTPRAVVLLDNDFFGQPRDDWEARIAEIRAGAFRVNFSQGINIRMINEESAAAIASIKYSDTHFTRRRIYTAWDNLGQERVFFKGLETLKAAGVPAKHVMVYMLIGYAPGETMGDIMHRYRKLVDAGCKPFPMVYDNSNRQLKRFQRWVVRRYDQVVPWPEFAAA